jgi:phospholipid transport system substrate-binding protein
MEAMKQILVMIGVLVGMIIPLHVGASDAMDPMTTLKGPVEEVIKVLGNPEYSGGQNREAQQKEIHTIAMKVFDFVEISKRALARNWKKFSPDDRRKFTDRFTELLLNTYTRQMQGKFSGESASFIDQQMLSETKASVKSLLVREGIETPVNYSMISRKGQWRVYDIQIEGVSLVGNYRTQFRKILAKESPSQLIARIEAKIAANEE